MKIQREDIRDACGHKSFARGRDYFESGRVLSLEIESLSHDRVQLIGNAQGSGGQVYQQEAILDDSDFSIDIDGGEVGRIEADGWNGAQLAGLNNAPAVTSGQAELLTNALLQTYP
ncbi:MAG: hypothetical protein GY875_02535, partial [Gammaproteobacteria bacterium]|nr:hypothetical protein [Gammaproteobacteria bacterium]